MKITYSLILGLIEKNNLFFHFVQFSKILDIFKSFKMQIFTRSSQMGSHFLWKKIPNVMLGFA